MNINLINEGYTEQHRETVHSRYGRAEVYDVYAPSGRLIGYQVYRNKQPIYAPFMTLQGARAGAKRIPSI
jgi:hypothetical protein